MRLGGVEGTFTLPDPLPARLLFISAGSGITPIMSMLRSSPPAAMLGGVVHVHSTRAAEQFVFARELRELARAHAGYRLHEWTSGQQGRLTPARLQELCPDWSERETFLCGPAVCWTRWARTGAETGTRRDCTSSTSSRTSTSARASAARAARSACAPAASTRSATAEQPILVAGEQAGATMPFGCRMGICHSCVGRLRSGRVRDLRTGRVHGQPGELLQTCINAPEGAVEIDL